MYSVSLVRRTPPSIGSSLRTPSSGAKRPSTASTRRVPPPINLGTTTATTTATTATASSSSDTTATSHSDWVKSMLSRARCTQPRAPTTPKTSMAATAAAAVDGAVPISGTAPGWLGHTHTLPGDATATGRSSTTGDTGTPRQKGVPKLALDGRSGVRRGDTTATPRTISTAAASSTPRRPSSLPLSARGSHHTGSQGEGLKLLFEEFRLLRLLDSAETVLHAGHSTRTMPAVHLLRARCCLILDRFDDATDSFNSVLDCNRSSGDWNGGSFLSPQEYRSIEEEARAVALAAKLGSTIKTGNYRVAIQCAEALQDLYHKPGTEEVELVWRAAVCQPLLEVDREAALRTAEQVTKTAPSLPDGWYWLSNALLHSGDSTAAEAAAHQAQALWEGGRSGRVSNEAVRVLGAKCGAIVSVFKDIRCMVPQLASLTDLISFDAESVEEGGTKRRRSGAAHAFGMKSCVSLCAGSVPLVEALPHLLARLRTCMAYCLFCLSRGVVDQQQRKQQTEKALQEADRAVTAASGSAFARLVRAHLRLELGNPLGARDDAIIVQSCSASKEEDVRIATQMLRRASLRTGTNPRRTFRPSPPPSGDDKEQPTGAAQGKQGDAHNKTHYEVLGVPIKATPLQIRKAYRVAALRWHPDKWSGAGAVRGSAEETVAAREFRRVADAYRVLSDAQQRLQYDCTVLPMTT